MVLPVFKFYLAVCISIKKSSLIKTSRSLKKPEMLKLILSLIRNWSQYLAQ